VTDRRRDPLFQAGSPAYHRIMQRVEEGHDALAGRVEAGFDRVIKMVERMERDIAQGEQDRDRLTGEMREIRRDLGELRDAANLGADKAVAAVVAAAPEIIPPAIVAPWHKTVWGRVLIAASGFTTIMIALDNVPDAVRGWDKFWAYLRNEPAPVVRPKDEAER